MIIVKKDEMPMTFTNISLTKQSHLKVHSPTFFGAVKCITRSWMDGYVSVVMKMD